MPAGSTYAEVAALTGKLNTLAVDSIALSVQPVTHLELCDVTWGDQHVQGIGRSVGAAMEDAYRKIRNAIIINHPSVVLPPE